VSCPAPRVAAYGYFGIGNLGNEGSLAALLTYLRQSHPQVPVSCFALDPDAVQGEHGIHAVQLNTFRANPNRGGPLVNARKAIGRLRDIPRTYKMLGDVDVVIVPGTGALETQLGIPPWGLPYWLFLVTVMCRLRRRKIALVSVGAEYAKNPIMRFFYRWTVRLADSCSYRDENSRQAVRAMGVNGRLGEVYPDIAFALPTPEGHATRPGHVAIGVMAYSGGADDPVEGTDVRGVYVENMAQLVTRLVDEGRSVTLVIGDFADREVAAEIHSLVRRARPNVLPDRLAVSAASDLQGIMAELSRAEVVVASRFHNVIAALMMAKPTVSLGYAGKHTDLLAEFGLLDFAQGLDAFDVDRLTRQIVEVLRTQPERETLMKDILQQYDDELGDQFRRLSADFLTCEPGGEGRTHSPQRARSRPGVRRRPRR
jgi:polysaccharide pyruvyl transferase WcaK-like protein